jgi:putative PIN family toxin of toxin-antitoxin system
MRVFFDASVIIAALLSPTGGSALLFKFIKAGLIVGLTSKTVLAEVLGEDKPEKIDKQREDIEQFVAESGLLVREAITEKDIEPYDELIDAKDAHLIAGAQLTKRIYLVSLDKKHVLKDDIRKQFLPLKIVSPKELIEELVQK